MKYGWSIAAAHADQGWLEERAGRLAPPKSLVGGSMPGRVSSPGHVNLFFVK